MDGDDILILTVMAALGIGLVFEAQGSACKPRSIMPQAIFGVHRVDLPRILRVADRDVLTSPGLSR